MPEDSSCSVIFAAYDEDGVMTNTQTVTNIFEAGTSIVTPGGFDTEGASSVKIMLWDGLDSLKPLCNNYEMQL